ncbi:MAG TPA: DUF2161 family putative PD-(D/E)XK-type phosphodiesterase [Clostridia bacterium]|nr:DUF2161 family putative PD-(D/E)XK-type phosphodiesterase [Clostridia bacterium]
MVPENKSKKIKETDLFQPLKVYLEGQGYSVHSEVRNCDIVARKGNELILVELKSSITLNLLIQAAQRKEISDSVYIAVPVPRGAKNPPNFKRTKTLLRRLEIGCILVDFMQTKTKLRIELHPVAYKAKRSHSQRRAILREIDGRYAEFNQGGEAVVEEKITAYKQEALRIAHFLRQNGPASPAQLRNAGTSEKTQAILLKNVYGWFERQRRGVYQLHPAGHEALAHYVEKLENFNRIIIQK